MSHRWPALLVAALTLPQPARAQVDPPPPPGTRTVVVTPGAAYEAGGLYSGLLGGGYRALWTTPIEVPVADLGTLAGGLTPRREGGGMTTRTLHLDGADGRRYVFRSVNKRPADLLEDFEGSPLESILQDQISSFHPTGAPVVAHLLEAVGVLHPEPVFMVVPDDPRLEEFREAFAGLLVLFEERPDDGPDGAPGFAGSTDIEQTDELFEVLEDDPLNLVDAEVLLRSRLVDLLVGDRDRSHNNHLWARFDATEGGSIWRVIPRDRDQAFVRFDGVLKALARRYDRRLVTFSAAYPDIDGLTRNAWDIDRNLLVFLTREQWDWTVDRVVRALTDEVISDAVARMPPEHVAIMGEEMRAALRARRDHLPQAAGALYDIVFGVADVHGTDVAEDVRVIRESDGSVSVAVAARRSGRLTFARTFDPRETREVRLYLHGGGDRVVLAGEGSSGPLVRVIGGGGNDRVADSTSTRGARTVFYDADADSDVQGVAWSKVAAPRPFSWFNDVRDLDWGSVTIPEPLVSYDVDRGLVLAAGARHERYAFLKRPYSDRINVLAGWSAGINEPLFDYAHLRRQLVGSADLRVRFRWSGLEILNYYGLGNDTRTDQPLAYHRVAHKQVSATVAASFGDGRRRFLEIGPTYTYTSTDTAGVATFIADNDPYGSGQFTYGGVRASFDADERDMRGTPTSGFRVTGGGAYFPSAFSADRGAFGEAHGQIAAYLSPAGGNPVLALRGAGKRVWGRYPFTEAAFLGGPESLRGLREQRFAGDGLLLGSAEVRVELGRVKFPVPTDIGVHVLADAGRVFYDESTTWHTAVGGGLWFALINRSNLLQVTVARAEFATRVMAGIGFAF